MGFFERFGGGAERRAFKTVADVESEDRETHVTEHYEALVKETQHSAAIRGRIMELQAQLTSLQLQAEASTQASTLYLERIEEMREKRERSFGKLKSLESFTALTSSFIQEILIARNWKRENSVKRKRSEVKEQMEQAGNFQREAQRARMEEVSRKESIANLLAAMYGASRPSSPRGGGNRPRRRGVQQNP